MNLSRCVQIQMCLFLVVKKGVYMDILAKLIGLYVISAVIMSVPILFTLSIVLQWPLNVFVPLTFLFLIEYGALVTFICKSMTEKERKKRC